MNERIRELRASAFAYATVSSTDYFEDKKDFNEKFDEKFAELIVRECTKVIVHGGYWSGGPLGPKRQCTPPEIAQMIKEHFGVEE